MSVIECAIECVLPLYGINQDCCPRCGMSGLEMLQQGNASWRTHLCEPWRVQVREIDFWRREVQYYV